MSEFVAFVTLALLAMALVSLFNVLTADRDEVGQRIRAKVRYQREVERNYHSDLEVPAFLRETAATRRSRYIGRRPA